MVRVLFAAKRSAVQVGLASQGSIAFHPVCGSGSRGV